MLEVEVEDVEGVPSVEEDVAVSDVVAGLSAAGAGPLALEAEDDERESVMYQPLPLKTMPTG